MQSKRAIWVAVGVMAVALAVGEPAHAQVTLNGRQTNFAAGAFTIGNFLMVPLNETLTSLGAGPAVWDPERGRAHFTFQGSEVLIRAGSGYAIVDGQAVVMGVPAVVRQNRLFIPLSFMREQFGVSVDVPAAFVEPGVRARVLGFRGGPQTPNPGAIAIGGTPILELSATGAAETLDERATLVTERMTTGLQRAMQLDNGGFNPNRVTLRMVDGTPVIFIADVPIISVTEEDAAAHRSTPQRLAFTWLRQIRSRLNSIFPAS
ncbi:MAG TPA: copper amine oxidase N-terminal domain-containing protein [Armatimonadetes bacterium]|jgi:hypothetical protein|nr:copper amine oxidase N-terminal domain-containing protein [Armatimonadota bacterium]